MSNTESIHDWLRAVATAVPGAGPPQVPVEIPWQLALEQAQFHNLEGPAMAAWIQDLRDRGISHDPELKQVVRELTVMSAMCSHRLQQVFANLAAADIPALPLKGPALSQLIHGPNAMRICRDLDLLIAESHIDRARAALAEAGFVDDYTPAPAYRMLWQRANYEWTVVHEKTGQCVELHWAMAPPHLQVGVTTDALLSRAGIHTVGNYQWPWPEPEDAVLFLCIHGAKHGWSQMGQVADLLGLLRHGPALDPKRLWARAEDWRVRRILAWGMHVAMALDNAGWDPSLIGPAGDPVAVELARAAEAGWSSCRPEPTAHEAYRLLARSRERRRDRVGQYAKLLFQPTEADWQSLALPSAFFGLYPVFRPIRLAWQNRHSAT